MKIAVMIVHQSVLTIVRHVLLLTPDQKSVQKVVHLLLMFVIWEIFQISQLAQMSAVIQLEPTSQFPLHASVECTTMILKTVKTYSAVMNLASKLNLKSVPLKNAANSVTGPNGALAPSVELMATTQFLLGHENAIV